MKNRCGSSTTYQNKKKKNAHASTSDIISHLPDNVIENILMCLPIQDAVRTSVLSRKWRYIWVKLPHLVFDDTFCRESIRTRKLEVMMTIYQVLLLHRGPILKFALSFTELESCSEIDQLILFVKNNGIQEFTLHIGKGEPYKLPSSLFSCLQLKHLNLGSCMFKPPPGFQGFSRLLCLELCNVVITAELFSSLISSCPLLERLKLECSTSVGFKDLEIDAPNLRFLSCEGLFSSVCLKNTIHLAQVSISLYNSLGKELSDDAFKGVKTSNSIALFGSLPVIEFLELDYYYVKYMAAGGVPRRLPTTLSHLKIIKLHDICFGKLDEVSIVLCLIRSSPNLEKIIIEAYAYAAVDPVDPILELLELQGWPDVSLNQLREVEIQKLSGMRSELDFIKLLLAKSPMLEKMLIEPNSEEVVDQGLSILKELTLFRRSSPHAEITYNNPDED